MVEDNLHDRMNQYVNDLFAPEDDMLREIIAEAERRQMPQINIEPFDGRLLQLLIYAVGAKKVVEIGTLAGYSGLWMARALPPDGKLYTCEVDSKHAKVSRIHFAVAGMSDRVELLEGPALDSLHKLGAQGPFDFVFIDANKEMYPDYLEWTAANLRPGGMFAAHNALSRGRVLAPADERGHVMAAFNQKVAKDDRFESSIINMGDGMMIGVRKP